MKVIPKLNLNQNPQNCEEGSLVFAKNMKLDSDGSLTTDFGSEDLQNCTSDDVNFVGHVVGLDNKIYLFSHKYNDNIYEYDEITKKAKNKVRNEYNWSKISQDTHFAYQKAICQSMAEKQKRELEQERAKKTKKAKNTEKEITNLLDFKKRHAYA